MSLDLSPNTRHPLTYFKGQILQRLHYWGNHQAVKTIDISTLDRRCESVLNVISFGLDLQEDWTPVRDLIIDFTGYMERRGHWQAWETLLKRAIDVAQQVGDQEGAITLSALLARLYQRRSRPRETIYYYRRVIRTARQAGNRYEEARACSNLGFLYVNGGQWRRAEILCCYALAIFEGVGSNHGRAHTENHLGLLYARQRAWAKAEHHLKQACTL